MTYTFTDPENDIQYIGYSKEALLATGISQEKIDQLDAENIRGERRADVRTSLQNSIGDIPKQIGLLADTGSILFIFMAAHMEGLKAAKTAGDVPEYITAFDTVMENLGGDLYARVTETVSGLADDSIKFPAQTRELETVWDEIITCATKASTLLDAFYTVEEDNTQEGTSTDSGASGQDDTDSGASG